jgi:methionyl-tRNA synthetase
MISDYAAPSGRGDQCEACTRPLDPTDLISARSAVSGSDALEVRETRHLFLR